MGMACRSSKQVNMGLTMQRMGVEHGMQQVVQPPNYGTWVEVWMHKLGNTSMSWKGGTTLKRWLGWNPK